MRWYFWKYIFINVNISTVCQAVIGKKIYVMLIDVVDNDENNRTFSVTRWDFVYTILWSQMQCSVRVISASDSQRNRKRRRQWQWYTQSRVIECFIQFFKCSWQPYEVHLWNNSNALQNGLITVISINKLKECKRVCVCAWLIYIHSICAVGMRDQISRYRFVCRAHSHLAHAFREMVGCVRSEMWPWGIFDYESLVYRAQWQ